MERCPVINTLGVLVFCFLEKELKKLCVPLPGGIKKGVVSPDTFWVFVLGMLQVEAGNLDSFLLVAGAHEQHQDTWITDSPRNSIGW